MIAIITDFGYRDHYAGVMKGVIATAAPGVPVVDITHGIPRHDVLSAAYVLAASLPHFPRGTVFLVVVDPGVGTERRAIAVRASERYIVCPDNGVITFIRADEAWEIPVPPNVSATFHGRDVFAPAAALIARGDRVPGTWPSVNADGLKRLAIPGPQVDEHEVLATVIYVDAFGNAALNLRASLLPFPIGAHLVAEVGGRRIQLKRARTFADVPRGTPALIENSEGYAEIAVNMGSAESMGFIRGAEVKIRTSSPPR